MSKVNVNEQDNSIYRDQQFISISYNGNTNNIGGATPPQPYELPIASATTLGGIKVGNNLNITADGTLNAVGGSGGGAQPDWNQSDSAAPDYIKNRPFYEEVGDETTVEFGEGEFQADENQIQLTKQEFSGEFAVGDELTFTINTDSGEPIQRVSTLKGISMEGQTGFGIGNLAIVGMGDNTGEDYVLAFFLGMEGFAFFGMYMQMDSIVGTINNITIECKNVTIYQVDKKFIPKLDGYIEKSPNASQSNPNIIIGKDVIIDSNSAKNVIAGDGVTIVDDYNPDRHNSGIYIINQNARDDDGSDNLVGNIYLYDQRNVYIGSPYQEGFNYAEVINYSEVDETFEYTTSSFPEEEREKVRYFVPILEYDDRQNYFVDFKYDIQCYVEDESHFEIQLFFPKDVSEATKYGSRGIQKDGDYPEKYNELLTYVINEFNRYYDETGNHMQIMFVGELYSTGGQGNTIIGMGAGVSDHYMDCTVIGRDASSIGHEDYGFNTVIGAVASASGKYATAIGYNCNAGNMATVVGYDSEARNNRSVVMGYHITNTENDLVNIADAIKVDIGDDKNVSFPQSRAMIIKSSTPNSNKKFKITVDDTGTISATEV